MARQEVNFIVTDLDDTIWDWFNMWYGSFEPYLNDISTEFNKDINALKAEFKKIHQKYHTTEAAFRFTELEILTDVEKDKIRQGSNNGRSIYHEYNFNKKNNLKLYDTVLDTLKEIKSKGTIIVGFTESSAFFTKYRLKHLKLDGIIDYIYAPIGADIPEDLRVYPTEHWEPEITEFRYLSQSIKKPNPEILEIILSDFKAKKENTIYIGDKPDRDIYMAQQVKITSVYAKYGHLINDNRYNLLREVTHWTDEDVEREKRTQTTLQTSPPDFTLYNKFDEIIPYFDFVEFPELPNRNQIDNVIDIWKGVIDVQKHFNDIELKIRNYALTAFTFIIAGIGFLEKEHVVYKLNSVIIPASSIFAFIGLGIIWAFYFMDKFWYHRLLDGAVNHSMQIEKKWGKILPELNSSSAIKKTSPFKLFGKNVHSKNKYWIFYGSLWCILTILALVLLSMRQTPTSISTNNVTNDSLTVTLIQPVKTEKVKPKPDTSVHKQ